MDVLCVGHAAYDIIFSLNGFPREDRKYAVSEGCIECGGGPAANAAYLLARWGLNAGFVGLAGKDVYGEANLEELRAAGGEHLSGNAA